MSRPAVNLFKWRRYRGHLILLSVRWYLEFTLSYRQLTQLLAEHGWKIHHSSVFRWVQRYAPELEQRCRPYLRPANRSYRVDETYIKVKGEQKYLYRAVDKTGMPVDFLLTAKRDKEAAKRFFRKVFRTPANPVPRVINVDKNAAYPAAVQELQVEGTLPADCQLRQCKYLNNILEQDHRNVKRRTRLAMGYGSFRTAWRTIRGIEIMHMLDKGRMRGVPKGNVMARVRFLHKLFGLPFEMAAM
jgi:IS6 family transposase